MKKLALIITLIFAFAFKPAFSQGLANASVECQRAVAFYNDYMKQNNLKDASRLWRDALRECPPGVRQSIYTDGIRIFKYFISETPDLDPALRTAYVDSIMMMYDLRIEHFPRYATSASTFKVYDLMEYRNDDEEVIAAINRAMEIGGDNTDPSLLVIAMQKICERYSNGLASVEDVMAFYSTAATLVEHQAAQDNQEACRAKQDIDNLFVGSGIASCENIVDLFGKRFEEAPDDIELATTIVSLLSSAGCFQEELFLETVETLYRHDPTNYIYIRNLYQLYAAKGDTPNAIKMLEEAIASDQSGNSEDANMLINLANLYLQTENLPKAAEAAREALQKDSEVAGKANLILGLVWGSLKCPAGNEVEVRAKYWVAVDHLIRARNADPSIASEANNYISAYSQYFPLKEDAFMYDIIDGASYTVNCSGMRATTTVRTRR